jgi:hypothetical protein
MDVYKMPKRVCQLALVDNVNAYMKELFIYVPDPENSSGEYAIELNRPCENNVEDAGGALVIKQTIRTEGVQNLCRALSTTLRE